MNEQELDALLVKHLQILAEHFEAIQIFASITENGETTCVKKGVGNWYARQGMAHEFIENGKAQEHANQISQVLNKDEQ
jgi:hypothetical protein